MESKKRARVEEEEAAVPPAAGSNDSPSPARKAPLPDPAAAPADDEHEAAAEESGAEDEEEDDDEQVERFYALLANIRALRGLVSPHVAPSSSTSCDSGGGASSRKRLRAAEPPWRPAFRMEDFEEPVVAPALPPKRKQTTVDGNGESASGARPAVAVVPPLPHAAAVRSDSGRCKK